MEKLSEALTPKDVTRVYPALTRSEAVLANLRSKRRGPKFYKVGKKIVYRRMDIEAYLFSNPVLTMDSLESQAAGN